MSKKIAVLLCGELRTFDNQHVIKNWDKFRKLYDIDIYVSTWSHRGRSEWSVRNKLNDKIFSEEIIKSDYVKNIVKSDYVKIYDYKDWFESTKKRSFFNLKDKNISQYNATFGLSFLKQEIIKLIYDKKNTYDVLVVSRPDAVFLEEPPTYFFNSENKIWHQKWNFSEIIYSTFYSSTPENIIKLCNWYDDDEMINLVLNKINRFEHCHVIYKQCELLNIENDTYHGTLFCEPYRYDEDLNNFKNSCLGSGEGKESWFLL